MISKQVNNQINPTQKLFSKDITKFIKCMCILLFDLEHDLLQIL